MKQNKQHQLCFKANTCIIVLIRVCFPYHNKLPAIFRFFYSCTFFHILPRKIKIGFGVHYMDRVKRIWYLSPMRAAKVQASLRIRAVSPEPSLLAHTSSESRGTFRQKARSLAPLNGWACAVKVCHDGMLEYVHLVV